MAGPVRGSIAHFATYRPSVPLDIFCLPIPPFSRGVEEREVMISSGYLLYNYNCRPIPPGALKVLLTHPKVAASVSATNADVDAGRISGFVHVSERGGLEILCISVWLIPNDQWTFARNLNASMSEMQKYVKVFPLFVLYGKTMVDNNTLVEDPLVGSPRMEDSGCFGGGYQAGVDHSILYVSTKEPVQERRRAWTAVYKTNLRTGRTDRLTPPEQSDLSPAVSPSGMLVAVATFEGKGWDGKKGWDGEIEDLQTNIYVMNVDVEGRSLCRRRLITNGGWPAWASENVIYFHRKVGNTWGVFRLIISTGSIVRMTPEQFDAMTPAAISETRVAVAIIREKSKFTDVRVPAQYRHIEIFDAAAPGQSVQITQRTRPKSDHYSPFVLNGGGRVGYHRCRPDVVRRGDTTPRGFEPMRCPVPDIGLIRLGGVFPTISRDGSKMAFVDNAFKALYIIDGRGLRKVYETATAEIFCPMWNQNTSMDVLYFSMGSSFMAVKPLEIYSISNVSSGGGLKQPQLLTKGGYNNAFPSSSPDGRMFVFRSTRNGGDKKYKNLYIMTNASVGEYGSGSVARLTNGQWTDTHCQWSPHGDWVVFSSTRDKPAGAPESDNGLDPGYFAVYLVKVSDLSVVVRVLRSGFDGRGHVNHPVWSPDGRSIAVTADFAAVSAEPISMPLIEHSVRPYGDIFVVDIDPRVLSRNWDLKNIIRLTHSRYEGSTPIWTVTPNNLYQNWNHLSGWTFNTPPECPYAYNDDGEGWRMTGHLCLPKRCC